MEDWLCARSPPAPLDKGGADRQGDLTIFNPRLLKLMQRIVPIAGLVDPNPQNSQIHHR
jgi:hypothetical protein